MKTIEGSIITIAKVLCGSCAANNNDHYLSILRDRKRTSNGDIYYIEFNEEKWPNVIERIRRIKKFLSDAGNTIFSEVFLTRDQIFDLWKLLRRDILSDVNGAKCISEVYLKVFNLDNYTKEKINKNLYEYTLYKSKNQLMINSIIATEEKNFLSSATIGWYVSKDMFKSNLSKILSSIKYLFKINKYPIDRIAFNLNTKDAIDFLYIIYNLTSLIKN